MLIEAAANTLTPMMWVSSNEVNVSLGRGCLRTKSDKKPLYDSILLHHKAAPLARGMDHRYVATQHATHRQNSFFSL